MLDSLRNILESRLWERENIPFFTPQISFDILLFAAIAHFEGRELAIKHFYLTLGFSEDRTREVIQSLEKSGWLAIRSSKTDKRAKTVVATDKALGALEQYTALLDRRLSKSDLGYLCPNGKQTMERDQVTPFEPKRA